MAATATAVKATALPLRLIDEDFMLGQLLGRVGSGFTVSQSSSHGDIRCFCRTWNSSILARWSSA